MDKVCTDKGLQRQIALTARRKLSDTQREVFSRKIADHLLNLPFFTHTDTHTHTYTVLAYAATFDEVDLSYFVQQVQAPGFRIAYPVSYKGGIMKAYVPDSEEAWETGKYGIRSPKEDCSVLVSPEEINAVIVPCVAFDDRLRRLGHGAGYYDRYLPLCPNAKFICVAFEAQKLDNIVTDQFDTPMDCIVTEENIYWSE